MVALGGKNSFSIKSQLLYQLSYRGNQTIYTDRDAKLKWQAVADDLFRYVPSGKYFARVRVGGKLIRHSSRSVG